MDIQGQRFMALEGTNTWALATIRFAAECDAFFTAFAGLEAGSPRIGQRRKFEVDRHCFLIAAFKLLEHSRWAVSVGILDASAVEELERYAEPTKLMRDLNEHKLEYFKGGGRKRPKWMKEDASISAAASSTVNTRIGNVLDWREVAEVAKRLQALLPGSL